MKKKLLPLLVFMALVSAAPAFAQLSEGSPSATVFKTGNRPGAGDFGLYFGSFDPGRKRAYPIF